MCKDFDHKINPYCQKSQMLIWEGVKVLTSKGQKENISGDGIVSYLDRGMGYITVNIFKNIVST